MMNIVSIDQILNLIMACLLLILSIRAARTSHLQYGLFVTLIIIAVTNIVFYSVAIFTDLNEMYRYEYASISGIRSLFTVSTLCGVCWQYLRTRR